MIEAFKEFLDQAFNLFSDLQYVVSLFPQIEMAVLPKNKTTIFKLLSTLQQQIWERSKQFYVEHIRAHSNLPGLLHTFNQEADLLT